jgi:carbon storage regulator
MRWPDALPDESGTARHRRLIVLVLTRRVGERVRIGRDIELVVLQVRARQVRLGITAPASIAVHREELYLKVRDGGKAPCVPSSAR